MNPSVKQIEEPPTSQNCYIKFDWPFSHSFDPNIDSQIEPPIPTSVPKLDNKVTIGPHIPTAAKHKFPTSSILSYKHTMMEYKILTN